MVAKDPTFQPAWPVARNPCAKAPIPGSNRIQITDPEAAQVLDLGNSLYNLMLRCLAQAWDRAPGEAATKQLMVTLAREAMWALVPVGEYLASLPAGPEHPALHAGLSFSTLRDVRSLPEGHGEMLFLSERMEEIAKHAERLFPEGHELCKIPASLRKMARKIEVPGAEPKPVAAPLVNDKRGAPVAEGEDDPFGIAEGKEMTLHFNSKRCIHSRRCVLGAPDVFLANVVGEWLFPDKMLTADLRGICHTCPSGAITYDPKGDTPPEPAPLVNSLKPRENGPYAVHATILMDGKPDGYRATLCRCGASKNEPYCDGSHNMIGFRASGEPETRPSDPLKVHNGELRIDPEVNGPLQVTGNLEICTGTRRNVDRVQSVRLCRCGGSKNKPFCDNTHLKIGFRSDQ